MQLKLQPIHMKKMKKIQKRLIIVVLMNFSVAIYQNVFQCQHDVIHIKIALIGKQKKNESIRIVRYLHCLNCFLWNPFIRSDELNCTSITPRTNHFTFDDSECTHPNRICAVNGQCIRVDQLCDGKNHCPDGMYLKFYFRKCMWGIND